MNNITGEPIQGAAPQEVFLPKPAVFERVAEISQLQDQVSGKYDSTLSSKLYDAKRQLTHDVVELLDGASTLSPQNKLKLATEIIPLVSWDYNRNRSDDSGRNTEVVQARVAALARHRALDSFLQTIPDEALDDTSLSKLLDIDESNKYSHLDEVRKRVVRVLNNSSVDRAKPYLERLSPRGQWIVDREKFPDGAVPVSTPSYRAEKYTSEWGEIIGGWSSEDSRPYIDRLVARIDETKGELESFGAIASAIKKQPQEEQYRVIREVHLKHGINGLRSGEFFSIVKSWPPDKAKPLLREILSMQVKSITYADRDYEVIAIAMSDWPSKDVEEFLADQDNTRWMEKVAEAKSQPGNRYTSYPKSYKDTYKDIYEGFKLSILRHRDEPFDDTLINWLVEAGGNEEIIDRHPELFTPQMAAVMIKHPRYISYGGQSYFSDTLQRLTATPLTKQYEYMEAFINGCGTDEINSEYKLRSQLTGSLAGWDEEHLNKLIDEIFNRSRTDSDDKFRKLTVKNAFEILGKRPQVENPAYAKEIARYTLGSPYSGEGRAAERIVGKLSENEDVQRAFREGAQEAVIDILGSTSDYSLGSTSTRRLIEIANKYDLGNIGEYKDRLPVFLKSIADNFGCTSLGQVLGVLSDNKDYAELVAKTPDQASLITQEDINNISELHITLLEAEELRRAGINISEAKTEEDYQKIFEALVGVDRTWQDEESIGNPFMAGVELFGYCRMFTYLDRRQVDPQTHKPTIALALTRHDALHSFEDVLEIYNASQLTSDQFWGNILNQVRIDDRTYDEGNAHQHFNAIAATANQDVAGVVSRVQEYRDITRLQELATFFETPQQVFASWNNLKRYSELEQVLEQTEILDELKELKAQGKDKLYAYVETLAFHPASKVNMQSVIQFWRDPQSFIEATASHTPEEVHSRKKPSNYIEMPNLDLTAEELRDALVEGKMDDLQAFSALEITYDVPISGKPEQVPLREAMRTALGSRKLGVEGTAKSTKRLFSELNSALKPYGLTIQAYLEGKKLPEGTDPHQIEDLIYHPEFGTLRPRVASQRYVARINLKSDPEGVLAGNDTANCMPFGDGKTTVYTFNPNTAQFLLQMVRKDGTARTIAQSVLTKDMDIGIPVPEVLQKLQEGGHLEQVLPETVVRGTQAYVACDNVEVAPNYGKQNEAVIEAIYRDFFREYVSRFGTVQRLVTDKVVIGEGYADALTHLPEVPNTYAPQAPVSYSDKTGDKVFVLDLTKEMDKDAFLSRTVSVIEPEELAQELPALHSTGLDYLTFEDALRVAYLEGKAYSDNQSLIQYLHNMENALIAKDINNAAKGRPNMSLKYTDDIGKMRGYFLAYEGVLKDQNIVETDEGYQFADQPVLYLLDLASDRESPMTGGRLINGFIGLYRQNYLEQGNLMPLFMQAREQTSFKIIQRQLDKISQGLGINFELIELPTYTEGEDIMHPVIIRPVSRE